MSSAIAFLESLGRTESLGTLAELMKSTSLSCVEQALLIAGDSAALAAHIGARTAMACLIIAPDNEPMPQEVPAEPDEVPDDEQQQAA